MAGTKPVQKEISRLKSHTGFWLRLVSNAVSHRFAARVAETGVTVAEWVILREMYGADVTAASQLADSTGLTRGAVSKLMDRLHGKKLITREEAAGDRRYQDVCLTAAGRELVPRLAALADENDALFFSHLSATEHARLLRTLRKLADANGIAKLPTE